MVAFSGSFNPGLLVYPYPDENPNYPPQVGMVPIGLREAMEPVQHRVGDFDNTQPITQLGRALAGDTWRSYFEDYYNRVWMIPTTVDFGPITATTLTNTVAVVPDFDPAIADGRVGGICVDLFRRMEAREPTLRITGDQAFLPLRRLEKKVLHGQLDVICGVGESPARRDHFIAWPARRRLQHRFNAGAFLARLDAVGKRIMISVQYSLDFHRR